MRAADRQVSGTNEIATSEHACDVVDALHDDDGDRESQMPTTPVIHLDECIAALATPTASGFRIVSSERAYFAIAPTHRPYLLVARTDLEWYAFDPTVTRVLLRIDGNATVDDLVRCSGASMERVCAALGELASREIISFA